MSCGRLSRAPEAWRARCNAAHEGVNAIFVQSLSSLIVCTFIFSMYLLILLLVVWDMDWFKLTKDYTIEKMKTKSVSEKVSHSSTTPTRAPPSPNTKEGEELLFLKLLRDSTSNAYD